MKTVKFILIALTGALLMLSACRNGGGKEPKPESFIEVTPTELHFTKKGGMQKLTLSTYDTWESSVDAYWCTISPRNGSKNATIEVTVDASTEVEETTAVIKFSDPLGNNVKVTVKRAGTGEKCKASDYPQVTIGTQVWMAENYRCSRYDTESEAYKEGRYIIPTSGSLVYTPYYTEVSDTSKWDRDSKKIYGVNLKDE
ncbi:MAG: hypothetical protein MJ003_07315, partial [Paludibacteraceae bacterium]|nr:hypothetical protein [Paludibacteraceae bacterium]